MYIPSEVLRHKWRHGDPINDDELKEIYLFYRNMLEGTRALGVEFFLAEQALWREVERGLGYLRARNISKVGPYTIR